MRSEYKILISSVILVTALIVPSITMTTSWYSDVEETDVNVSILSIEVKDNNGTIVLGNNWKWTLEGNMTYNVKASTDTYLFVTGNLTSSTTIDSDGKIRINSNGTYITTTEEVVLSLLPPELST